MVMHRTHPDGLPTLRLDPAPVPDADWARLMRAPSLEALGDEMAPAIDSVRCWATNNIKPYCATRWAKIEQLQEGSITLDNGERLPIGESFRRRLERFNVDSAIVMGFTLGDMSDQEVTRLWDDDQFEVSYLLSAYSAALAETMRSRYTQELMRWADARGFSLLTPEGPGYGDWSTQHLKELYEHITNDPDNVLGSQLKITAAGALTPMQSMLLVYGVSHDTNTGIAKMHQVNPCSRCRLAGCKVRRVAFDPTLANDRLATD